MSGKPGARVVVRYTPVVSAALAVGLFVAIDLVERRSHLLLMNEAVCWSIFFGFGAAGIAPVILGAGESRRPLTVAAQLAKGVGVYVACLVGWAMLALFFYVVTTRRH